MGLLARLLLLAACCGFIVPLSGCAANSMADAPSKGAPGAGEGTIMLSTTGNSGEVNGFNLITVEPAHRDTNEVIHHSYTLARVSEGLARDTALFIGVMPAGEYIVTTLSDATTRKFVTLAQANRDLLGSFTVKAGATGDLGRIVVTQINSRILVGRSRIETSNVELVRRFSQENAQVLDGTVYNAWTQPRQQNDQVELYALYHPIGANALTELPDGRVAAASRLGTVLLRDADGAWRALRTGRLESLMWLTPASEPDSLLYAVGEFDTLVRFDRDGNPQALDKGNLPNGNLFFITGGPATGWFVGVLHDTDIEIYRSASLTTPDWKRVAAEKGGVSAWSGARNVWAWDRPGGFGYAYSDGRLHLYDYASGSWTERKAPNDDRIVGFTVGADRSIGVLTSPGGGLAGVFSGAWLSRDDGATWTETHSPAKVKISPPLRCASGTLLEKGGVFHKTRLFASTDQDRSWHLQSDQVVISDVLWALPHQGVFRIANGLLGYASIHRSTDDGQNWKLEYSTFDSAAWRAQQRK
jgi:hypothetical protein